MNTRIQNLKRRALLLAILPVLPFSALSIEVLPITATWRYNTSDLSAVNWTASGYSDSGWASGAGVLYNDNAEGMGFVQGIPVTLTTQLPLLGTLPAPTYYFRTTFTITNKAQLIALAFYNVMDDGGVLYLNGREIQRVRMAGGAVSYRQLTSSEVPGIKNDASEFDKFILSGAALTNVVEGVNYFACEVHQYSATSSDVVFGSRVTATYAGDQVRLIRGPYLQLSTTTNITICWRTDEPAASRVFYGTNLAEATLTNETSALEIDHFLTLTGLQPDTRYYYAVGGVGTGANLAGPGEKYRFLTHPQPGTEKPIRVWVIGDAGVSPYGPPRATNQPAVRDCFAKFNGTNTVHAWLQLGDNAYRNGTDNEHQIAIFEVYSNLLCNTVTWPTLGNHDVASSTKHADTYPYFKIFHLPTNGQAGGVPSGTEHYYSFDVGMVHFICIDSVNTNRATNSAMANWLRADLAANKSRWTVAYWHYPPYSRGGYDSDDKGDLIAMRTNIGPIIEAGGVDLVLSGHSHVYERSKFINGHYGMSGTFNSATMVVQAGNGRETNGVGAYIKPDGLGESPVGNRGTVYIVDGCSGDYTVNGTLNHPAMNTSLRTLGSTVLDFTSNRLDVTFVQTNGLLSGDYLIGDHFTILKEGTYPPVVSNAYVPAAGAIQMTVHSRAYRTNIIEATDTLSPPVNWHPVRTNFPTSPSFNFGETNAVGKSERYYRVRRS